MAATSLLAGLLPAIGAEAILKVGIANAVTTDSALVGARETPAAKLHPADIAIVFCHSILRSESDAVWNHEFDCTDATSAKPWNASRIDASSMREDILSPETEGCPKVAVLPGAGLAAIFLIDSSEDP